MRTIIGVILGIVVAGIFELIVFSALNTEPCEFVRTLQCHVFAGQQYVNFQAFTSGPPAVIAWIAGGIFGGVIGRASG